jgi:hypothetical protein
MCVCVFVLVITPTVVLEELLDFYEIWYSYQDSFVLSNSHILLKFTVLKTLRNERAEINYEHF